MRSEVGPAIHESGLEISDDGSIFILARALLWDCMVLIGVHCVCVVIVFASSAVSSLWP